jgi:hypothetical protein
MSEAQTVPTHDIETPQTKTIVTFRDWITGADDETLKTIYLKAENVNDVALEADHKAIELCIVKVGEVAETDKLVAAVLALPLRDTKAILAEVKKIVDPLEDTPAEA